MGDELTVNLDALNRAAGNWARADAENRELRELVTDMHALLQRCCDATDMSACLADWCRFSQPNGACDVDEIEDRMRELGIEA